MGGTLVGKAVRRFGKGPNAMLRGLNVFMNRTTEGG